jgi:osmotically-inducible protein OsmY
MPAVHPTGTEPDTQRPAPPASPQAVAERGLRSSRYSALQHVSCDCRGGVLVLRGCLPTYYLKQVAQEVVAHLEGVEGVENQILVVPGASRSGPS